MPETLSPTELLTEQFYEWELRGRGWMLWPAPVDLEPPFRPFLGHYLPRHTLVDDGQFETPLSRLADSFLGVFRKQALPPPEEAVPEAEEPAPEFLVERGNLIELQVALPPEYDARDEVFEQCLFSLSYCKHALAFEVVANGKELVAQVTAERNDAAMVASQLKAHFPEAVILETRDFLLKQWRDRNGGETVILEFGLDKEFMMPLQTSRHLPTDPLVAVCGALERLGKADLGLFQVLFQPVRNRWAESVMRAVTTSEGESFFENAPELVGLAKQKLGRPLFAVVIRVGASGALERQVWETVKGLAGALRQFGSPQTNELIPLDNDPYDSEEHRSDLINRCSRRSGMILSSDELASIAHLPTAAVRSRKLRRETKRTKAAAEIATGEGLVLGENTHEGVAVSVTQKPYQRLRHTHVIGASGTGKSTLLLNLIAEDMRNGAGLAVLDPHGDLIEKIIGYIPKERLDDVILLDPGDAEYSIGFNILSAHSDAEKTLISSDLVSVFRRLSTSWGDQMTSVLGNAVLAFLESTEGGTLADLRRFLVEPGFRNQFLSTVKDSEVVYYWQREFPLLAGKPQAPLLTRLDTFLRPKPIRYMVSQKANRLDFAEIMDSGKIFLAKLSQGEIGEENAHLLGTLLVSKLHQMTLGRQKVPESARRDFFLYIDECHNFITPSMASILTGVRKYHLGLILAHQELRQLQRDSEVSSAVLSNPYTRVCFRVGDDDARKLADGFSFFEAKDLQSLGIGEAICRMERADFDFNLSVRPLQAPDEAAAGETRRQLVALTRQRYAVSRQEIEARLAESRIVAGTPDSVTPGKPRQERAATPPETPPVVQPIVEPPPVAEKPVEFLSFPQAIKRASRPVPSEPAPLGRGGPQHKYLQHLIKEIAVGMGLEVEVEKQIESGDGSVDVVVRKGGKSLAFEISITTTPEHELQNARKCVKAGFDEIAFVCPEGSHLAKIREVVSAALPAAELGRVRFCGPDEVAAMLLQFSAKSASKEGVSHGRKTKVMYRPLTHAEARERRETLAKITTQSLKKMKGGA